MSKRKRTKRTLSQKILWVMSFLIVGSMVVSLVIVALQPPTPAPTPFPTLTAAPPSVTPLPTFAPFPTASMEPSPTQPPTVQPTAEETEPVVGPDPATATPTIEPTLGITPTIEATPPLTSTPSSADGGGRLLARTGAVASRWTEGGWLVGQESTAISPLPFIQPCAVVIVTRQERIVGVAGI
ncbi:hypothetical protein ACFLWA_06490 [Chloroflexota bacterium]